MKLKTVPLIILFMFLFIGNAIAQKTLMVKILDHSGKRTSRLIFSKISGDTLYAFAIRHHENNGEMKTQLELRAFPVNTIKEIYYHKTVRFAVGIAGGASIGAQLAMLFVDSRGDDQRMKKIGKYSFWGAIIGAPLGALYKSIVWPKFEINGSAKKLQWFTEMK